MAESDSIDEDRLRQQAQQRLERRKRRLQSPEERLALITGRPVEAESRERESTAEDPPLELLTRGTQAGGQGGGQGGCQGADLLANLLAGTEAASQAGGHQLPGDSQQVSGLVWVMLGLLVRITLETEYSGLIGHNVFLPFALTLSLLISLGHVNITPSTSSTILSAGDQSDSLICFYFTLSFSADAVRGSVEGCRIYHQVSVIWPAVYKNYLGLPLLLHRLARRHRQFSRQNILGLAASNTFC